METLFTGCRRVKERQAEKNIRDGRNTDEDEIRMQIIEQTLDFQLNIPSAVAIGKFDGIHRGHKCLLEQILEQKKRGKCAVVFTFDPSPYTLFSGKQEMELTTREEKRSYFEQMGIDVLIEFPMTFETAAMPPEQFVKEILCEKMQASYIAAGVDVSFGDRGKGDMVLLQKLSSVYGYELNIIDKVKTTDGKEISSTLVRDEIRLGNMQRVQELLGEPYFLTGVVKHGKKFGRTIGMPTVNLIPKEEKLLPPNGVYFSEVQYGEKIYKSITNIGYKPTVNEERVLGVESFLYDFAQDIYGQEITVRLFAFKRPEMKFRSVEELKQQMAADIAEGRYYFFSVERKN